MGLHSGTVGLNRTYLTACTGRGRTGMPWPANIRPARAPRQAGSQKVGPPGSFTEGTRRGVPRSPASLVADQLPAG